MGDEAAADHGDAGEAIPEPQLAHGIGDIEPATGNPCALGAAGRGQIGGKLRPAIGMARRNDRQQVREIGKQRAVRLGKQPFLPRMGAGRDDDGAVAKERARLSQS